jgi:hypothetical protein
MVTTVAELVPSIRQALAISADYDAVTIPAAVRRVMKRLLRDYNFPKSIQMLELSAVPGASSFGMPASYKRLLQVRWVEYEANVPASWSDPLHRRESFVMPTRADAVSGGLNTTVGLATHYWVQGLLLKINNAVPSFVTGHDTRLQIYFQSMQIDEATEAWMLADMEDLIHTYTCVRLAMELRKMEAYQAFSSMLGQDLQSIAIFSNELEWEGVEMTMHQADNNRLMERYPR